MRFPLKLHPKSQSNAAALITVEPKFGGNGALTLHYALSGNITAIKIPEPHPPSHPPSRLDNLWQHTCFELFIMPGAGADYIEFNLSPSGDWAAYKFNAYRKSAGNLDLEAPPKITASAGKDIFELTATLHPPLKSPKDWKLAISAVVEETNGHKSYWALAHPQSKPDFHHLDSFTLPARTLIP